MTLAALLERAALRRPHADAVVDGERRLTYSELSVRARSLAEGFRRLGVGRGDRVLIVLRNRLEHVLAYWALQLSGGVPTPANFRLASAELRYVLQDCGARVALCEASTAATLDEAADGTDVLVVAVGDNGPRDAVAFEELTATPPAALPAVAAGDLSLILYTSGTTG